MYKSLYISILFLFFCILYIAFYIYHEAKERKQNIVFVNPKAAHSSIEANTESATLPRWVQPVNDIQNTIREVYKQSMQQQSIWHEQNSSTTFSPETQITMYFKEFYGDAQSMERRQKHK